MGDVICEKCGEPWEFYYVQHEMTEKERKNLLNGHGCPCCGGEVPEHRQDMSEEARMLERLKSLDKGTDLDPIAHL